MWSALDYLYSFSLNQIMFALFSILISFANNKIAVILGSFHSNRNDD